MKMKTTLLLLIFSLGAYTIQAQCGGATFEEQNGIVVIQAETVNLNSNWKKRTNFGGYTGSSYITWEGSEFFGNPGNGVIEYTIKINNPGVYRVRWRSTYGIGDVGSEHNDTWLKFPNAFDFYGQKNNTIKYPKGGTFKKSNLIVNGSSGNGWMKVFRTGNNKAWSWSSWTSDFESLSVFVEFNNAGVYTMQLSARSKAHFIDRVVLYKPTMWSNSQATNIALSETKCGGGNNPPPPPPDDDDPPPPPPSGDNEPPTVSITSPSDGQNFNIGSTVTVNLTSGDSDGNVVKHEIFVNNSKVDTDGSSYSAHKIRNISAGSYEIRAKVTDNEGETAEDIVNITVGGGGGDPPPPPPDDDDPPPPPPTGDNVPPTVSITNPNDGQNFNIGSTVTVNLTSGDSDGSVVKHEIFVNNSKVDTDGASFTPHKIRNISAGSYAIRAKVTDNEGATSEDIVNITVGGGGGDPPPPPPDDDDPPPPSGNIGLFLVDAITDTDIAPLPEGSVIADGSDINIRATATHAGATSLRFNLTGATNRSRTENVAPYALFGDIAGDYNQGNLNSGAHKLVVLVYSGPNGSGTRLGSRTVNFTVTNGGSGKSAAEVYAYPNPVKGNTFSVKLPEGTKGEVFYRLINTSGAEIETGKINVGNSVDSAQFKVQSFDNKNNGVYYLLMQTGAASYAVPIIKE